jgi:beta-N-acetylhexosaminidase
MERATVRRRRLALATLGVLAVAGFGLGAMLGSGGSGGRTSGGSTATGADAGGRSGTAGGSSGTSAGSSGTAGGSSGTAAGNGSAEPRSTLAEKLTPSELAGERVVVSVDGTGLTPSLRHAIHAGKVAGVVLYEVDFPSRGAGRKLIAALQAVPRPGPLHRLPLLVMTDQEGGQVKRVDGPPDASAAQMGEAGPADALHQGRATGADLADLGVNVDLAPVLDVGRPGGVIAATERSFGSTAVAVTRSAVPFAEGLQAGGVAATAKHFPGLGSALENTDFEAQSLTLPKSELRAVDEAPYRAYIAAGGRLVMISTATYPALSSRPAAFSHRIVTGELRRRLGFRGVTITDSLGGAAVAAFGGQREAAVDGASAGDDILLFDDLPSALAGHEALVKQQHAGSLKRPAFLAAVNRVLRLRAVVR